MVAWSWLPGWKSSNYVWKRMQRLEIKNFLFVVQHHWLEHFNNWILFVIPKKHAAFYMLINETVLLNRIPVIGAICKNVNKTILDLNRTLNATLHDWVLNSLILGRLPEILKAVLVIRLKFDFTARTILLSKFWFDPIEYLNQEIYVLERKGVAFEN